MLQFPISKFFQSVLLAVVFCSWCLPEPVQAQQLRAWNWYQLTRDLNRANNYDNARRRQVITAIQNDLEQARDYLTQTESELETAKSELETAESKLTEAKAAAAEKDAAVKAALKRQKELETQILDKQTPESAYGKAQARLEETQVELDAVVRKILGLPEPTVPMTEQERLLERSRLSEQQKSRLKASPEYEQAVSASNTASDRVREVRQQVWSENREWQQATQTHKDAMQVAKTAGAASAQALQEAGKLRKQVKDGMQAANRTRQGIAQVETQLRMMGATPK